MDYDIPGYSINPLNLNNDTGKGIAIYSKDALDKSVIQIDSHPRFEEVCLMRYVYEMPTFYFSDACMEVRHRLSPPNKTTNN